jgi:hypothetical protein
MLKSIYTKYLKEIFKSLWLVIRVFGQGIWYIYTEILYEPFFFGATIFLIFNRLQAISDYITENPNADWWQMFMLEIQTHPTLYTIFFLSLLMWGMIKWLRHKNEKRRQQKTDALQQKTNLFLEAIAKKMGIDTEVINKHQNGDENRDDKTKH